MPAAPGPWCASRRTAEYIHGPTGIDGADLPEPSRSAEAAHAVDFLVDALSATQEPITLATLGATHQCGTRHRQESGDLRQRTRDRHHGGVRWDSATSRRRPEFNVHADPHAAHVVFEAGVPLTMIGLDVTHQAIATPPRLEAIRALGTAPAAAVCGNARPLR